MLGLFICCLIKSPLYVAVNSEISAMSSAMSLLLRKNATEL